MFNLILNENMKIYIRTRTWVFAALVFVVVLGSALISYSSDYQLQKSGEWKQSLIADSKVIVEELNDPAKRAQLPEIGVRQKEGKLKLNEYYLNNNTPPNQLNAWTFAKAAASNAVLISIIAVVVAGDIMASEFNWGTIKLLLIRPVSRTKIYLSKYLAALLFGAFMLAILLVSAILIGGILFGFGGFNDSYVYLQGSDVVQGVNGSLLVQVYLLKAIYVFVIATIAFMISSAFRSSVGAISVTMIVILLGQVLANLLAKFSFMKFFLFTNIDMTQFIEGSPLVDGVTPNFASTVILVYIVLFHFVGWRVFTKRDVAA